MMHVFLLFLNFFTYICWNSRAHAILWKRNYMPHSLTSLIILRYLACILFLFSMYSSYPCSFCFIWHFLSRLFLWISVGDLHGDLAQTRCALELAGVLSSDGQDLWIGGETVCGPTFMWFECSVFAFKICTWNHSYLNF